MKKEVKKSVKKVSHPIFSIPRTFGQKSADAITKWAGSWAFILLFFGLLILWILINTSWIIFGRAWDPKPFILLNLVLSCIAAIQAPIILMSQNRATEKNRQRAEYDYAVNRKAEKEIEDIKKQLNRIENYMKKK